MYISQMTRNQQMMYRFMNRTTNSAYQSQIQSQLSSMGGFTVAGKNNDPLAGMLEKMGISGLQGRTVREMAQYQLRVQNGSSTAGTQQTGGTEAAAPSTPSQGFSVREQYTPISDEATEAMQKLALADAKNSAGGKTADSTERANLIREQLKDVDPSKRTAAFNTMNKVWESETERLGKYIKEKTPDWNDWGDKFDTSILDEYKPGVNVWV